MEKQREKPWAASSARKENFPDFLFNFPDFLFNFPYKGVAP